MSDTHSLPYLRRLDMNLLLTFDALMRTRSATASSALLHKTQPAISRELARLRLRLEDPLLVVVKGRFIPTERALELHSAVHDALAQIESALRPPEAFDPAKAGGVVNIGTGAHSEILLAAPLIERLHRAAPGITLRFQSVHGDFVPDDLDAERLDLAIGLFGKVPARFHRDTLLKDRRVCVVSAKHPWAGRGALTLADLPSIKWFAFAQMYGRETNFDRALKPDAARMEFSAYLSGFGITPYVLLDTDYATTMSASVARAHARHFPLATLELPASLRKIELVMVWPRRLHTSPLQAWLRGQIREVLRERADVPAAAAA
ncbi:LysR family transcriptional regulator [Achromobacter xylosoxidans]|uniref:LysR family transcriptional regulator n=1 Tax=Alcaligenes xylosoxydans xylosoxydans TaxID=85698 RepID=UPI000B48B2A2|nr:LysR family transcriptional regulator [Achromobacter xylosoxidans]